MVFLSRGLIGTPVMSRVGVVSNGEIERVMGRTLEGHPATDRTMTRGCVTLMSVQVRLNISSRS